MLFKLKSNYSQTSNKPNKIIEHGTPYCTPSSIKLKWFQLTSNMNVDTSSKISCVVNGLLSTVAVKRVSRKACFLLVIFSFPSAVASWDELPSSNKIFLLFSITFWDGNWIELVIWNECENNAKMKWLITYGTVGILFPWHGMVVEVYRCAQGIIIKLVRVSKNNIPVKRI